MLAKDGGCAAGAAMRDEYCESWPAGNPGQVPKAEKWVDDGANPRILEFAITLCVIVYAFLDAFLP
jgi:hypothetical protein